MRVVRRGSDSSRLASGMSPWQTVTTSSTHRSASSRVMVFDPRKWRPQTPTTAYMELRDDDPFWVALRVAVLTDELIRAAVHTGQFSHPEAEEEPRRRPDRAARTRSPSIYPTAADPIVNPRLEGEPSDLRECGGVMRTWPQVRRVSCRAVHLRQRDRRNASRFRRPRAARRPRSRRRAAVPTSAGSFIEVDIAADSEAHRTWKQPVAHPSACDGAGWKLVGLERMPHKPAAAAPAQKTKS